MVFLEQFMYHQNTLKILSHQYVGMFAVIGLNLKFSGLLLQKIQLKTPFATIE